MRRKRITSAIIALTVALSFNPHFATIVLAGESVVDEGDTPDNTENTENTEETTLEENVPEENIPEENITEENIPEESIAEARSVLTNIVVEHTIMALVYLSEEYAVKQEASFESATVATVASGQQVQIQDVVLGESGEVWAGVTFYHKEGVCHGYIQRYNLACSDEVFLQWEKDYQIGAQGQRRVFSLRQTYADVAQFPESYREDLTALKQAHPNWTFVKMNTKLDWNVVLMEEMKDGRSLIEDTFPPYMKEGLYSNGWAYATRDTLAYYMDPRNWLGTDTVFQFEQLTYNETYHTEAAVQSFLNNTFMVGNAPKTSTTYARAFWSVGSEMNVSPFHLASRVFQEQGAGKSSLISGSYPGYEGYYNFFNIGASGTTEPVN